MKSMAIIGITLFGLITIAGLYKITIEIINESNGINNYTSGYLKDLILAMLIVLYAFIFSLVVFIKIRNK